MSAAQQPPPTPIVPRGPAMLLVFSLLLTASTLTVIGEILLKLGVNAVS